MKSKNTLYLFLGRFTSLLFSLIVTPVLFHSLGEADFGVYAWPQSLIVVIGLVDIGFFLGASRRITEAFQAGDAALAWRRFHVALTCALLTICVGILIFTAIGFWDPFERLSQAQAVQLMFFGGLQFGAIWLVQYFAALAAARDTFVQQSFLNFCTSVCGLLGALMMLRVGHGVVDVVTGAGIGSVLGISGACIGIAAFDREFRLRFCLDREIVKDLGYQGLTNYGNRLTGAASNRSDKVLIKFYSDKLNGAYQLMGRPVEILTEQLQNAVDTMMPDIIRKAMEGDEVAGKELFKSSITVWALGCCLMVVPLSVGNSIMRFWLHREIHPAAGLIMMLWGLNYASDVHFRALGTILIAKGLSYKSIWFMAVNGTLTLALVLPVVRQFGLLGVAVLNAILAVIQFYPRVAQVNSVLGGAYPVRDHLLRILAILLVASVFAALGWYVTDLTRSLWVLLLAPVLAISAMSCCIALRLTAVPSVLRRFWKSRESAEVTP